METFGSESIQVTICKALGYVREVFFARQFKILAVDHPIELILIAISLYDFGKKAVLVPGDEKIPLFFESFSKRNK